MIELIVQVEQPGAVAVHREGEHLAGDEIFFCDAIRIQTRAADLDPDRARRERVAGDRVVHRVAEREQGRQGIEVVRSVAQAEVYGLVGAE
jgi:hypothetical protein